MPRPGDPLFQLAYYRITGEMPHAPDQARWRPSKVQVGEQSQIAAGEGNGPVNALDKALRTALSGFTPVWPRPSGGLQGPGDGFQAGDGGAGPRPHHLHRRGAGMNTVGVAGTWIEASWAALSDSIEYKLVSEGKRLRPCDPNAYSFPTIVYQN